MKLPRHIAMTIEHNPHVIFYQRVEEWLGNLSVEPEFMRAGRQECIDTQELWVATWYPDTPVGSYQIAAPTFYQLTEMLEGADD